MSANIEKELDFADYDKDEPEESKAAAKAAKKAADIKVAVQAAPTQKEIDAFVARMNPDDKDRVLVAMGVSPAAKKTRAPKGAYKTKCDDALKNINPTIQYIFDKHQDEHLDLYLLGLYVKDFENRLTEDDDHDGFKKWLTDNKESIGLKKQMRKSTTSSVPSTPLGDLTIKEDEGAGAGSP